MLEKYEGIIFDLDGTLVDSMWIWKSIDIEYLEERALDLPENLQEEIEGMSFTETAEYFKREFELEESIEEIKEEWHEMAIDYYENRIDLKDNVINLLVRAKELKKPMGIGTSNSRKLASAVIKKHKIDSFFKTLVTSCDVNKGKPNPDVFLAVAKELGVAPEKCLVFEDTYAGALAAKRAGMDVVVIYDEISAHLSDKIKEIANQYIMTYEEIL